MSVTVTSDPIIDLEDAQEIFDIRSDTSLAILVNALTEKFKRFTGRVQLNANTSTDIEEFLQGSGTEYMWLHCSPVLDPATYEVTAKIYQGNTLQNTLTYSAGDLYPISDQYGAKLQHVSGVWPDYEGSDHVRVTYRAGWSAIPGDVLQGAIMQGKVDLLRMQGEVGVSSRGAEGESTKYDTAGLIKTVRDLWDAYRVIEL